MHTSRQAPGFQARGPPALPGPPGPPAPQCPQATQPPKPPRVLFSTARWCLVRLASVAARVLAKGAPCEFNRVRRRRKSRKSLKGILFNTSSQQLCCVVLC